MPVLHTDDGPRRLRAVWLGPTGATLPFEWTYVQWVATLAAIPVTVGVLTGLGMVVHQLVPAVDMFLVWAVALIWGPALGVLVTVKVMRHVSFDQPLSARVHLVRAELRLRPRRRRSDALADPPLIAELAGPAARSLGWGISPSPAVPAPVADPRTLVLDYLRSIR